MAGLQTLASNDPYLGYAYAYPHKTAYRAFVPALSLRDVWRDEDVRALFLYVHVPLCEMRCGFCNLFTHVGAPDDFAQRFVDALYRQADAVASALPAGFSFARFAVGGGTPTFLGASQLGRVLTLASQYFQIDHTLVPSSVEASPATVQPAIVELLTQWHVDRVSMGVQSFLEEETRALGRPQKPAEAHRALRLLRDARFPTLNVDLIYGAHGQTEASFVHSIASALEYAPEELFLYPLYVRPLTGLGRKRLNAVSTRHELYRAGRAYLLAHGYQQVTMRLFRRSDVPTRSAPDYCCQRDGMVGLGAGARSYTSRRHYSFEYAVSRSAVRSILDAYLSSSRADFERIEVGTDLSAEEQRRRFVIQSVLSGEGLDHRAYEARFGNPWQLDFPELSELSALDWAHDDGSTLKLTAEGYGYSDVIGPWLYSDAVRAASADYELR